MILQNIISTVTVVALFTLSVFGTFVLQTQKAVAQTDSLVAQSCPMEDSLWVSFLNSDKAEQIEDVFTANLQILNSSPYLLNGARVAIAMYNNPTGTVPDYWTVLPDEYLLEPGVSLVVEEELSLASVSAGEYIIRPFIMQGDESALLGSVLQDIDTRRGLTVVKTKVQDNNISMAVNVNGQKVVDQPILLDWPNTIDVKITTTNNSDSPLLNSELLSVITQGEIPLGAATWSDKKDSIMLIPGTSRVTDLKSDRVFDGMHTVFVGLMTVGAFQPLVWVPVKVGEGTFGERVWPYVSYVGLSNYPLNADTEIVTCVRKTGEADEPMMFFEEVGIKQVLSNSDGELASVEINSQEVDVGNYFTFKPGITAAEFDLTTDFLQQRFNVKEVIDEEGEDGLQTPPTLFVVETLKQSFVCPDEEMCVEAKPVGALEVGEYDVERADRFNFFWIYVGGFMVIILMIFIILKRLPPKEEVLDEEPKDESQ